MQHWFIPALVMALMVSPEALTYVGNAMGLLGFNAVWSLLVALLISLLTWRSYRVLATQFTAPYDEFTGLRAVFGAVPAITLPLCSRVVVWVCAGTLSLASAGYLFNEVFVLWFPNLLFSFCLLGSILFLNLMGPRVAERFQVLCVTLALAGLLIFVVLGLFTPAPEASSATEAYIPPELMRLSAWLTIVWLFVGVDFALWHRDESGDQNLLPAKSVNLGMVIGAVVLSLWGLTAIAFAPMAKLAETSVPHMVMARLMYGQTGRMIMGAVAILGSAGAVNALLLSVARMLSHMGAQQALPAVLKRLPVALAILAIGPAAMMALGYAGETITPELTKAGLMFWLLLHLAVHTAAHRLQQREAHEALRGRALPMIGALLLGLYVVGWIGVDPMRGTVLSAMLAMGVGVAILSAIWLWLRPLP
ncbi:MAG: hypothetical protein ETSY2_04725 [Candidatus Entotheonella gemina]|uniref:Amino acid permease/ SLC12A domain-containing protein n=3 Tax=Candidatus Entotheonella TaxID=93171 RepID=W4MED9_9BACT|nr:MAG: hypothetical protein ETSY2_04725 [Candidatus Entotheonella gemina]